MTSTEVVRASDEARRRRYFRSPTQISAEMRFCHQLARRGVPLVRIHEAALAEGYDISYGTVVNRVRSAEAVYTSLDIDDVTMIRSMIKRQLQENNLERQAALRDAKKRGNFKAVAELLNGADANLALQAKLAPGVVPESSATIKHQVEHTEPDQPDNELDEMEAEASEAEERVAMAYAEMRRTQKA